MIISLIIAAALLGASIGALILLDNWRIMWGTTRYQLKNTIRNYLLAVSWVTLVASVFWMLCGGIVYLCYKSDKDECETYARKNELNHRFSFWEGTCLVEINGNWIDKGDVFINMERPLER